MLGLWEALDSVHRKYTAHHEIMKESFTAREYCKKFNIPKQQFRYLIEKMIRDGVVEKVGFFHGCNYYRLTGKS